MQKWVEAIEQRLPLKAMFKRHLFSYQVPASLNFWYAFGLLAIIFVVNQLLSGVSLAMLYLPTSQAAFASIWNIMHEVPSGWFVRYLHTSGASFLFLVLYAHIFRAFLYGSYRAPRELVWILGCLLFVLMLMEAFFGYVLPWGQMSYWAAEVLCSSLKALPWIGEGLSAWLQGGQSLGTTLLQRFFVLHIVIFPLILLYLIKFHIWSIRHVGSTQPIEDKDENLKIRFFPHHVIKELGFVIFWIGLFFVTIFFTPTVHGIFIEKLNSVVANPSYTPAAIHPPWYLAPYFSILRSLPNLSLGLVLTSFSLLLWFLLPWLDQSPHRLLTDKGRLFQGVVAVFWATYVGLGVLAFFELDVWILWLSRMASLCYFAFFIGMPWYSRWSHEMA